MIRPAVTALTVVPGGTGNSTPSARLARCLREPSIHDGLAATRAAGTGSSYSVGPWAGAGAAGVDAAWEGAAGGVVIRWAGWWGCLKWAPALLFGFFGTVVVVVVVGPGTGLILGFGS